MARPRGLEPLTLGLEGRCSIRLSYGRKSWAYRGRIGNPSLLHPANWSGQRDLNPRPSAPKADALPGCAMPRTAQDRRAIIRLEYMPVNRVQELTWMYRIYRIMPGKQRRHVIRLGPMLEVNGIPGPASNKIKRRVSGTMPCMKQNLSRNHQQAGCFRSHHTNILYILYIHVNSCARWCRRDRLPG